MTDCGGVANTRLHRDKYPLPVDERQQHCGVGYAPPARLSPQHAVELGDEEDVDEIEEEHDRVNGPVRYDCPYGG